MQRGDYAEVVLGEAAERKSKYFSLLSNRISQTFQDPKECCTRLPSPVDAALNEICIANFSKNTERQQKDIQANEMPKGNCVSECIANLTKIYRGNGLVDRINLARIFFNAVSGEREWGDAVGTAVDICINESESSLASIERFVLQSHFQRALRPTSFGKPPT